MGLTPQQLEAAQSLGSVAVTAGAGTGKTHMLAERFLFHVREGRLSPLEVVAVTFTEKAAAELKIRIRQKMLAETPDQDEILAALEASQISTIHALAARICRDHHEIIGISTNFSILDESEGKIWASEKLNQALETLPLDTFAQIPYSFLKAAIWHLLEDPISAEKAFCCSQEDGKLIVQKTQEKALEKLIADKLWEEALNSFRFYKGSDGDAIEEKRKIVYQAMRDIEKDRKIENVKVQFEKISSIDLRAGSKKNWLNGGFEDVKTRLKGIRDFVKKNLEMSVLEFTEFDELLFTKINELKAAFFLVKEKLFELKVKDNVLSFADLEEYALQALKNPDVRFYYQQRWKAFLIDEFQDTNSVQSELLNLLTKESSLTIVGDEKQSIFGFRRADTEVFREFRKDIVEAGGKALMLSQSFRTHKRLVKNINDIFSSVLMDSHQELSAHRSEAPHPGPHLNLYIVESPENKTNKSLLERVEAGKIADEIKSLLESETLIFDKKLQALRKIRLGDIAILSRTWDVLDTYADALAGANIPAVHFGGGNLLATREAKDALAMLKFLADPFDDIALLTVLRSPFFGVSDKTLFKIARELPKNTNWWSKLESEPGDLSAAVQILKQILAAKKFESPSRLLQIANRLTGYLAVIGNLPQAARREADWRGVIEFIENQTKRGIDEVFGLSQHISRLIKAEVEIPRIPLEPGNAVSLMTIHAAKGLEWSVVVVPDLARQLPNGFEEIYFEPNFGIAFKLKDTTREYIEPSLYKILKQRKKEKEAEEAKRVLYVALTRARDRLILTSTAIKGSGIDTLMPGINAAQIPIDLIAFNQESTVAPLLPEPLPFLPAEIIQLQPITFGLKEITATALTDYAACPERFRLKYVDRHPGLSEGHAHARRIGKLVHKAIERNIRDVNTLRYYDYRLPKEYVEEALNLANNWNDGSYFNDFKQNVEKNEFQVRLPFGGIIVRGVIDLVGTDFVLDFKTDQEQIPMFHRFQLWLYAKATNKEKAHIAYLRHNSVHTFSKEDLAKIEIEAISAIENIRNGQFSATPSKEICCLCQFETICTVKIFSTDEVIQKS